MKNKKKSVWCCEIQENEYYDTLLSKLLTFMNNHPEYEYLNYTIDKSQQTGYKRFIGSVVYKKYDNT